MKRYVSNGKPSNDTKNSYFSAIDQFISWCTALKTDIFKINEQKLLYYRQVLINKDYKPASVKFKLTAIRRFYYVALKYGLIEKNPATDVHAQRDPDAYMPVLKYLTVDQLYSLHTSIFLFHTMTPAIISWSEKAPFLFRQQIYDEWFRYILWYPMNTYL